MKNDIVIKAGWSNEVALQMIADFMKVENEVFGDFCTNSYFETKYLNNIYGPSVLVVAYLDGMPVGADALWRNDVDGYMAYQSADTCVLDSCRGKGIFTEMVKTKLSIVRSDALVYGFPNSNSFPGFVKMGWSVVKMYKSVSLLCSPKDKECIDDSYARWWLRFHSGISYLKRGGCYYLVRKREGKIVGMLIGRVEEKTALLFPKTSKLLLLKYFSRKSSFYNKGNNMPLIYAKNTNEISVPYWKIDAV